MKKRLIFIQIPKSFKKKISNEGETFPINFSIPIPLELSGSFEDQENLKAEDIQGFLADLNMDMIISGMLRAIEERQVKQEWIDYYSNFILFLRPDILEICQTHEINKNSGTS